MLDVAFVASQVIWFLIFLTFVWGSAAHFPDACDGFCKTCQVGRKPNQNLPTLKLMPAFEEPFWRIIIECVGPLPKSSNQYLLTIMCDSTRFPEAIPLRKLSAPALIKYLTIVVLPKVVQSDQGSNSCQGCFRRSFMSWELDRSKLVLISPRHCELEGFRQTFKNMITILLLWNWEVGWRHAYVVCN